MGKGYPSDWSSRRKKALRRDNHRCQRCGSRGGSRSDTVLHVHHITPKSQGGSHRLRNLKTVCKSCHQEIHGHGVGGRPNSSHSPPSASQELDPEEVAAGLAGLALLVGLVLTGAAIMQVMPEGQTVTQSYELDFHLVNDPGSDTKYSLNDGPALYLDQTIHDDVISQGESTKISFRIANPTDSHMRGRVTVSRNIGWRSDDKPVLTIDYDLPPDTHGEKTVVIEAENISSAEQSLPATAHLSIENEIYTDGYYALHPDQRGVGNDRITVRKPLFDRFGFWWLCLVAAGILMVGVLAVHQRAD